MILGLALLVGCQSDPPAAERAPSAVELVVPEVLPSPAPAEPGPAEPPDIVLITVEGLRADHLALYGYPRDTMPWLRALAARGVLFERAYATSSWEVPTVASVHTGLYPNQHNIDRGRPSGDAVEGQPTLAASLTTLAERLSVAGYHTTAISASLHAGRGLGFEQGFERFVDLGFLDDANAVVAAQAQLTPLPSPRFTWVHLRDPRSPYQPRAPWFERYAAEPPPQTRLDQQIPDADRATRLAHVVAEGQAYDSELSAVDDALSRLVPALDPAGDAVVVVVGTHGEELGELGRLGRRGSLSEGALRVPLVVVAPGRRAGSVSAPVSQVDLLPTLVQLATGSPPADVAGHSLVPALDGEAMGRRAIPISVRATEARFMYGLLVDPWKMVRVEDLSQVYTTHLYNLDDDPGELVDLANTSDEARGALDAALDRWLERAPSTPPGPIQRVEREQGPSPR